MALDFSQTDLARLQKIFNDFGIICIVEETFAGAWTGPAIEHMLTFWTGKSLESRKFARQSKYVLSLCPASEVSAPIPTMGWGGTTIGDRYFFDADGKFLGVHVA